MRFSIDLTPYRWSKAGSARETTRRALEYATQAELAGFDAIWCSEDPDGWDAIAMLSAIAVSTERIGLTTGVINPFYRHPSQIASSVSTLDRLSGGRFRLGLGRGQTEWYGRSLGIPVDRPVERLEEAIDLLRQWGSEDHRASSRGPLGVADWPRSFGPLSDRVPILLAAAGPKAVRLAGRAADGLIFNDLSSSYAMRSLIAEAHSAADAAGRDPSSLAFVARPVIVVTDDPEPVLQRLKERLALISTLPGMDRLIAVPGFDVPGIMVEVRNLMQTERVLAKGGNFAALRAAADFDAAKAMIPTELVAELATVGPIEQIRKKLEYLAQLGVTEVVLRRADLPPGSDWADFLAQWR